MILVLVIVFLSKSSMFLVLFLASFFSFLNSQQIKKTFFNAKFHTYILPVYSYSLYPAPQFSVFLQMQS